LCPVGPVPGPLRPAVVEELPVLAAVVTMIGAALVKAVYALSTWTRTAHYVSGGMRMNKGIRDDVPSAESRTACRPPPPIGSGRCTCTGSILSSPSTG
jgi:hypothetical protein